MRARGKESQLNLEVTEVAMVQFRQKPEEIVELSLILSKIESMKGIEVLRSLRVLNLQSNHIAAIRGLEAMTELKKIDLSGNQLQSIDGLASLGKLEELLLAHNKISSLKGLRDLPSTDSLRVLDVRDNLLSDLTELHVLSRFPKLEELTLDSEECKHHNPICIDKRAYYTELRRLPQFSKLKKIDRKEPKELESHLRSNPTNNSQSAIDDYSLQKENLNTGNLTAPRTFVVAGNAYRGSEVTSQPQHQSSFADARQYQRLLAFKERMLEELEERNSKLQGESNIRYKELVKREHEVEKLYNQLQEVERRVTEKDQQLQQCQKETAEAIREHSRLSKDISLKNADAEKYLNTIAELRQELGETRAVLKDTDRRLMELNSKVLDNVNHNTFKSEEVKRKYEITLQELKASTRENSQLKQRILELTELTREWQYKYERKLDELERDHQADRNSIVKDCEGRMAEMEKYYTEIIEGRHHEYKEQLDLVQDEFKAALKQTTEKYKQTKAALDDRQRQDGENRSLLKQTLQKNADQENLIQELQSVLLRFRQEVSDIVREKEALNQEINGLRGARNQKSRQLQEQRDRLHSDKQSLERQLSDLRQKHEQLKIDYDQLEVRAKTYEADHHEVDQLNIAVETKNQMLQDKNETIESLKLDLEQLRQSSEKKDEQVEAIRKKYSGSKQKLKEMEDELANLLAENNELRSSLEQTNEQLQQKEQAQTKIGEYLNEFEENLKGKDQEIGELLNLLEECKKVTLNKNEEIEQARRECDRLRREYDDKQEFIRSRQRLLKSECDTLKDRVSQLEKEKRQIVEDGERSKREAKQNLQKLSKMFA